MTKLIGITGYKESGKDTCALAIAQYMHSYGVMVERRAFADKIKIAGMRAVFGAEHSDSELLDAANDLKMPGGFVSVNFPTWKGGKTHAVTGLEFIQFLGTEGLCGNYGENFHVDALLPLPTDHYSEYRDAPWVANFCSPGGPLPGICVVSDVRRAHEAERVKEIGGEIWEILRPGHGPRNGHSTEGEIPCEMVDIRIHNLARSREDFMKDVYGFAAHYVDRTDVEISHEPLSVPPPTR